jgi:hypothetical protein
VHPLQVAETQDIQIFILRLEALDFFVLQVGIVREAHRTPPWSSTREITFKIAIRGSSLSGISKPVNK